jgi:hypothetical protein
MSAEDQTKNSSLSLRTLTLLHGCLDDFVVVGKARRGDLAPAELEKLLRKAAVETEEIRQILSEFKRFRMR